MVPRRALAQSSMLSDATFANLVRQSVPAADPDASAQSSSTPSRNGRIVSLAQWNAPRLNFGDGFTANDQLPHWIYLNADGTTTGTVSTNVVGRFAYNVYETGGLLDANVAGHLTTLGSADLERIKYTAAGANLGTVGLPANAVDELVAFRSPSADNPADYVEQVTKTSRGGFILPTVPGADNNFFTSRQDLLRYAFTVNPGLLDALPFFTHISRFSTAPSFVPATPAGSSVNYAAEANNPVRANRFLPNVRVQQAFTRRDGTQARPGDPILNRRFPLSRLAWIGADGPVAPGTAESIQRDFGLQWDAINRNWLYVGSSGHAAPTALQTLEEVAAENREPNFFELLKAGILSGSVGVAAAQKTLAAAGAQILDADQDLQIIRIGANLIDQADNDNFPTTIRFAGVEQHGIEDLPYLQTMIATLKWRYRVNGNPTSVWRGYDFSTPTLISLDGVAMIWAPKLFSPNRSTTAPGTFPDRMRVRISSGVITRITLNPLRLNFQDETHTALNVNSPIDLTNLPVTDLEISSAQFANFRATPKVIEESELTNPAGALHNQLNVKFWNTNPTSGDRAAGFIPWQNSSTSEHIVTSTLDNRLLLPSVQATDFMLILEFWDGARWRAYDALAGYPNLPATGINTSPPTNQWGLGGINFGRGDETQPNGNSILTSHAVYKIDPRTTRWAASHGWAEGKDSGPLASLDRGLREQKPFPAPFLAAPTNQTNPGLWPEGGLTAGNNQVPGADGVWRPNDSYLGQEGNLYRDLGDAARRPVILQRPFRSVGEMGLAFRDTPGQTLNFFHERSADSALLDLFSVDEEPALVAGRINPNRASAAVLQAVLGTTAVEPGSSTLLPAAANLASQLVAFRSLDSVGSFRNKADLVGFISSTNNPEASANKIRREALIRGLADVAETTTWNLWADVVAQVGRVEPMSGQFIVDGESRTWSFFALDRVRGEIIHQTRENVLP